MHLLATIPLTLTYLSVTFAQQHFGQTGAGQRLNISRLEFDHNTPQQSFKNPPSLSERDASNRILNGAPAALSDFPFMAFLYREYEGKGKYCGGTLIAPNVIVTAAHCLLDINKNLFDVNNYYVSVGSIQYIQNNPNVFRPSKIVVHPQYVDGAAINDIGLLFLTKSVPSNIALPTKIYNDDVYDNMPVVAAGWGAMSNDPAYLVSPTLNYVDIRISSSQSCSGLDSTWKGNTNFKICTQAVNGKDTCYGDSGGPLVASVPGLKPLVGVTSGVIEPGNNLVQTASGLKPQCGQPGSVGFYTNVLFFADWISSTTNIPLSQLLYTGKRVSSPKPTKTSSSTVSAPIKTSLKPKVVSAKISTKTTKAAKSAVSSSTKLSSMSKTMTSNQPTKSPLPQVAVNRPTPPQNTQQPRTAQTNKSSSPQNTSISNVLSSLMSLFKQN